MSESLKIAPPKPWGIIATALWTLGSLAVLIGMVLILGAVAASVAQVQLLVSAARQRGWQAADYLGWIVPNPRDAAVMLAVTVALNFGFDALNYYLLGRDLVMPVDINTYRNAREVGEGELVGLWILLVVAAPLSEEIVFRGFLYRGWARSPRDVVPAVVVISALWAMLHVRYDWLLILQIFLFGLVLGWARWRSGSTMLTFAMHAFNNTWTMVEAHWLA
jgi:membrane protease YdiL (CAAX protease family)